MRTIKQIPGIAKDLTVGKFPDGTVQNEDDTQEGTPVIREIYGDILTNLYNLLSVVGIEPTGTEDSDDSQYQIVESLKKLPNSLNDIQQVLSLAGTVWSVPFDLSKLPNRYVFLAIASDNYVDSATYTFKGNEASPVYSFTAPKGFKASDYILVIIDTSGVKAISLNSTQSTEAQSVETSFGTPLAYNDTSVVTFFSEGHLFTGAPLTTDLQDKVRIASGDAVAKILDAFILKGHVLCFVYMPTTVTYELWQFSQADLNTAEKITISGISIPIGSDNNPYIYTDGTFLFITNRAGTLSDDFELSKFSYTPATPAAALVSNFALHASFVKTTNVVVKEDEFLFTYIDGVLIRFAMLTGSFTGLGTFKAPNGQIFSLNGSFYYSNGDNSVKWNL